MKINAVQKLTLLDYPGRLACTVFLSGCNLRCPFCHNAPLVLPEQIEPGLITQSELMAFLTNRRGKLDGVCISGGEPTLYPDLPELMAQIRTLGYDVKLDTNGTNPEMLRDILERGLADYVAMDIKNSPECYRETCGGVDVLTSVEESVRLLIDGSVDYEFRTTVSKPLHTPERMASIGHWLKGAKRYVLQPFEDSGNLVRQGIETLTEEELTALLEAVRQELPNTVVRGR